MYVVNIVRLRGPIACHRLACAALSPALFLKHAQTVSTPHSKTRQRLVCARGGGINYSAGILFQKVHSHLIVIPDADMGITGQMYGGGGMKIFFFILLIGSGHPISLLFCI